MNITINSIIATFGRLAIALVFLLSGVGKLAAKAATTQFIASSGLPYPELAYLASVSIELGVGTLLVLGYQTRFMAFILAGFSLVTALIFHNNWADQNQMIHFLKNISMMGGLLQVVAYSGGLYSLDNWMASKKIVHSSSIKTGALKTAH